MTRYIDWSRWLHDKLSCLHRTVLDFHQDQLVFPIIQCVAYINRLRLGVPCSLYSFVCSICLHISAPRIHWLRVCVYMCVSRIVVNIANVNNWWIEYVCLCVSGTFYACSAQHSTECSAELVNGCESTEYAIAPCGCYTQSIFYLCSYSEMYSVTHTQAQAQRSAH